MKRIEYFGKRTLDTFTISLTYEKLLPGIELNKIYPFAELIYLLKSKIWRTKYNVRKKAFRLPI